MTLAEKLIKVDEGIEKAKALNAELELSIYGNDTGKKSEYDEFWGYLQQNGGRTDYGYGFAGEGWTEASFKPKYNIYPIVARYMFCTAAKLKIDFVEHLAKLGVALDFSRATSINHAFSYCYATRIGVVDTRKAPNLNGLFEYSRFVTIEKLILKDDGSQTFSSTFGGQTLLENITIEGVIGKAIDCGACSKLTKASIISIVNALSTTTSGLTVTLSKTAVNNAFTTDEWNALRATKPDWEFIFIA